MPAKKPPSDAAMKIATKWFRPVEMAYAIDDLCRQRVNEALEDIERRLIREEAIENNPCGIMYNILESMKKESL